MCQSTAVLNATASAPNVLLITRGIFLLNQATGAITDCRFFKISGVVRENQRPLMPTPHEGMFKNLPFGGAPDRFMAQPCLQLFMLGNSELQLLLRIQTVRPNLYALLMLPNNVQNDFIPNIRGLEARNCQSGNDVHLQHGILRFPKFDKIAKQHVLLFRRQIPFGSKH